MKGCFEMQAEWGRLALLLIILFSKVSLMIDLHLLRTQPELVAQRLAKKSQIST